MYKFTNGIVVFDERTRDEYIKSGMQLIKKKEEKVNGKDNANDGIVKEKHSGNDKKTSKHK